MKISIITVSYNSEKTIKDTISSVLNQSRKPDEYFIIDGKSKDQTVVIAKSYEREFQSNGISYQIVTEKDKGIYDAMNKGIKMAKGDIIGIINSDDWYEIDALEKVEGVYVKKGFDMLYGDLRVIGKNGMHFIKRSKRSWYVTSRNWNHPTTFITKDIYNELPYDLGESVYADFDLFLKLKKKKAKIEILNQVLANYRLGGISNKKGMKRVLEDAKSRYEIYRRNGYSRAYWFECYFIESFKYIFRFI